MQELDLKHHLIGLGIPVDVVPPDPVDATRMQVLLGPGLFGAAALAHACERATGLDVIVHAEVADDGTGIDVVLRRGA